MYGKQMEMFEDGGLNQEGGMVDEVSGNDVPVGSTRSEVRDDIPAMLSEGEFVFPADVVRYFGLERLMEMRQQAKMGLKKMESMGQMGNSEEATMPDDLPFSVDELQYEEDDTEEYAQGGYIKAQQGTFVPAADNMLSSPSYFASNPVNIAPATTLGASGFTEPAPVATQTPADATQTQAVNIQPQTGSVVQPEFKVPTYQDVYTFKKYIHTTTKEIRDFPFYFDQPVTPIPEGFVPYTATEQQQPADTATQTTQMLQEDGGDDSEPMPTPAPVDYSKMGADEILQAYKNNQTASAIMMGVGAAFPPVGLFGAWATNREKNKITARMQELGLEVPKDEGIFGNVISGIKNLFGMDQQAATAATAATARGAGTGADAGTTAGTARAVTPTVTPRVATRPEGPASGMPAAKPKGRFDTPVGGGMPAAKPKPKAASAPVGGRGTGATAERGTASASLRGTTELEGPEATRNPTQKVLDAAVARSLKAGKSDDEIVNEGVKILEEAARVESAIKDQKNRGMQRGYNKGGLAARTK
jgi:hypothetical protein